MGYDHDHGRGGGGGDPEPGTYIVTPIEKATSAIWKGNKPILKGAYDSPRFLATEPSPGVPSNPAPCCLHHARTRLQV